MVELDKGYLVPKWLIKGLEATHKIMDKKVNTVVNSLDENEKGYNPLFYLCNNIYNIYIYIIYIYYNIYIIY